MRQAILRRWEEHYAAVAKKNPLKGTRAILAYNSVIDKVMRLDRNLLGRLKEPREVPPIYAKAAEDMSDLAEALSYSITNGLALEVICSSKVIRFLEKAGRYEDRLGGQVATVARLLSDFEADKIFVHPDRFDWKLASMYHSSRAEVPLRIGETVEYVKSEEFYWDCSPEAHYILEYPAGLSFGNGPAPRASRFIAAPMTKILFHTEWERALPTVSKECDIFLLAGLNHMGEDYEESFERVRKHIRSAKASNPSLIVHLEITSVANLKKREDIVSDIVPLVDSVGFNETELADIAFLLGLPGWERVRRNSVYQLEAMQLIRALGVRRVNMHTLGYYMALSPNPSEEVRESLLFAALVGGARASLGRGPRPEEVAKALELALSERGVRELERLDKLMRLKGIDRRELLEEGWCRDDGLVVVPTKIADDPRYTVGLGDTISGASVFSERWSRQV